MGPFASTDTLFPCAAGDLDLFTDMEISGLVRIGLLKPPITSTCMTLTQHHLPPRWSQASSSRKRDCRDYPSCHRHPVTAAAGSHEDLGKSEHEHVTACKRLHREIGAECSQSISRDLISWAETCAEPLTLVFQVSILTQKSAELREGGLA